MRLVDGFGLRGAGLGFKVYRSSKSVLGHLTGDSLANA